MKQQPRGDVNEASQLIDALGPVSDRKLTDNRIAVAVAACLIGFALANVVIWVATWPWIVTVVTGTLTGSK